MFFKTRWFKIATILLVAPILAIVLSSFLLDEDILGELTEKIQLQLNFQDAKNIFEKRNQFVKQNFQLGTTFECPNHPICNLKLGKQISAKAKEFWSCEKIKFNVSEEPFTFHVNNLTNGTDHPDYNEVARMNYIAKMPMQINFKVKLNDDCPGGNILTIAIVCPPSVVDLDSLDQCIYQSVNPIYITPPAAPLPSPIPATLPPPPPPDSREIPTR